MLPVALDPNVFFAKFGFREGEKRGVRGLKPIRTNTFRKNQNKKKTCNNFSFFVGRL